MISINNTNEISDINKILKKDFNMFDCVLVHLHPFLRLLTGIEPHPNYESMYYFATEDISTYIKEMKPLNSYLTVCSSGDQILNGILYGATKIDTFDKNYFTKHVLFLKIAALKTLNNEDFISFFTEFDLKLLEKILQESEIYIQKFWEKVFLNYNVEEIIKILFPKLKTSVAQIKKINPYLDPTNYEILKSIINNVDINFIESDLYGLSNHIDGKKYDAINLSNIYGHLCGANLEKIEAFRDFVMNKLYPHLNLKGTILISYLYAWSQELKNDFDETYKKYADKMQSIFTIKELMQLGLTHQNLSYSYLFDVFKNIETIKVPTNHVEYGCSKDMSHDLALLLKKQR